MTTMLACGNCRAKDPVYEEATLSFECTECKLRSPSSSSYDGAINKWNELQSVITMRTPQTEEERKERPLITTTTGATAGAQPGRFDLIPEAAIVAAARRFELGAKKHGENNWRKGERDDAFRRLRVGHIIEHSFAYLEHGNANDDNTGAIMWGACVVAHMEALESFKGFVV